MMYSEFIENSNFTENYISYNEYSTYIEPIYMDSNYITKYDFIAALYEVFQKIVYPAVETAIKNLSNQEKETMAFNYNNPILTETKTYLEQIDFEARKIAYEYMKLLSKIA